MTPHHIWALPYYNFSKFGPHLHRYNSVRVHPYAHPQHMKVLNHFCYTQYGCGMQSVMVYSLNHDTITSFGLYLTPIFQNLAPTQHRYNCVTVQPYPHPQHMNMIDNFVYFPYGCGMQSVVVYSLNHDTRMSFELCLTPIFQNLAPTCTGITV
jgi:hypothetical protein